MKKLLVILSFMVASVNAYALSGDSSIQFTDTLEGASETLQITVTNDSGESLTGSISYLATYDADANLVIVNDTCTGTTLADTQSCAIDVQFSPTAATPTSTRAYMRANFKRASGTSLRHSVFVGAKKVTSADAALGPDKSLLDFGFLRAGDPRGDRRTMSVIITNNGELASTAAVSASITGDSKSVFSVLGNNCPANLAPSASCRLLVSAEPKASQNPDRGVYTASLELSNLGDGTATQTLTLQADIENILIPEVSYPIILTRNEGAALKYDATSSAGSVQVVDPSVLPSNQDAADFLFTENSFDTQSFCKADPAGSGTDQICGVVIRFIPSSNPQAVYEINVKHPLNDGN